ncbi:MAG: hypothetical protein AAFU56_00960 [Pseudomonadota bacterium]
MGSSITSDHITLVRDMVSGAVGLICGTGVVIALFGSHAQGWLFWTALTTGVLGILAIATITLLNAKAANAALDERDLTVRRNGAARGYWAMVWAFAAAVIAISAGWISAERALIAVPLFAVSVECISSLALSQTWLGRKNQSLG